MTSFSSLEKLSFGYWLLLHAYLGQEFFSIATGTFSACFFLWNAPMIAMPAIFFCIAGLSLLIMAWALSPYLFEKGRNGAFFSLKYTTHGDTWEAIWLSRVIMSALMIAFLVALVLWLYGWAMLSYTILLGMTSSVIGVIGVWLVWNFQGRLFVKNLKKEPNPNENTQSLQKRQPEGDKFFNRTKRFYAAYFFLKCTAISLSFYALFSLIQSWNISFPLLVAFSVVAAVALAFSFIFDWFVGLESGLNELGYDEYGVNKTNLRTIRQNDWTYRVMHEKLGALVRGTFRVKVGRKIGVIWHVSEHLIKILSLDIVLYGFSVSPMVVMILSAVLIVCIFISLIIQTDCFDGHFFKENVNAVDAGTNWNDKKGADYSWLCAFLGERCYRWFCTASVWLGSICHGLGDNFGLAVLLAPFGWPIEIALFVILTFIATLGAYHSEGIESLKVVKDRIAATIKTDVEYQTYYDAQKQLEADEERRYNETWDLTGQPPVNDGVAVVVE